MTATKVKKMLKIRNKESINDKVKQKLELTTYSDLKLKVPKKRTALQNINGDFTLFN